MNPDLERRLAPLGSLTPDINLRFANLIFDLTQTALRPHSENSAVCYHFEEIENGEDDSAYVIGDGEEFHLHLDCRMPWGMVVDFMIHELAHVHSWNVADDKEDHCDEFGKSYALLYRRYLHLYDLLLCQE
jgi:hypothetical protein